MNRRYGAERRALELKRFAARGPVAYFFEDPDEVTKS